MRKKFSEEMTTESIETVINWAKGPYSRIEPTRKADGIIRWNIRNFFEEFGPVRYSYMIKENPEYAYRAFERYTDEEIKENEKLLNEVLQKYDEAWKGYAYLRDAYKQNVLTEEQFKECKDANVGGIFGYPTQVDEMVEQTHITYGNAMYIFENNISLDSIREEFKSVNSYSDSVLYRVLVNAVDIDNSNYVENYSKFIRKNDPSIKVFSSKMFDEMLDKELDENETKVIKMLNGLGRDSIGKRKLAQELNISYKEINEIEASAMRKIALADLKGKDYVFTSDEVLDYVASTNAIFEPSKEYRDVPTDLDYEKLMELVQTEIDSREEKSEKLEIKDEYKLKNMGFSKDALRILEYKEFETWSDIKELYIEDINYYNSKKARDEILTAVENFGGTLKSREKEKRIEKENNLQDFLAPVKEKVKTTSYEDIKINELIPPDETVFYSEDSLSEYLYDRYMFSNLAEFAMLSKEELEKALGEYLAEKVQHILDSIGVKNGEYQLEPKTKYEDFRNITIRELKPNDRCVDAFAQNEYFFENGFTVGNMIDFSTENLYRNLNGVGHKSLNPLIDKVRELYLKVENKPDVAPKLFEKETVLSRQEAIDSDLEYLLARKERMEAQLEKLNQKIAEAQQLRSSYEKIADKNTLIKDDDINNIQTKEPEGEEHE